jgi:hypothetical protein
MASSGLLQLFSEIWDEREHVSELSGKPLLPKGDMRWHHQFLHVLSRGTYVAYKFRKENIMLALPEEHAIQERYPKFKERFEELRSQYYKEIYHKQF